MRKIFPGGISNTPYSSFKIFFLAEGYTAAQSAQFTADCLEFIDLLYTIAPFNLTRARPNWLSVYTAFSASNSTGPAINIAALPNRTAFESSYTSTTGLLAVNQSKLNAFVDLQTLSTPSGEIPLSDFVGKGDRAYGLGAGLVVLLLPPIASFPQGGEFENMPGENDYHFIAISKDGLWHQAILRTAARCLGLGDEFELSGAKYLEPDAATRQTIFLPNLEYFESGPPNPLTSQTKWYRFFSSIQRASPPSIHPKSDPETVDAIPGSPPANPVGIEFYEGAGSYRTKVWRSAYDCLMRRRIGDSNYPIRSTPVPFCRTCRIFLRSVIW